MALANRDLKLLDRILVAGHALERTWPSSSDFQELRDLIRSASEAKSFDLKRLAFHADNLSTNMSLKHLSAILVPFERLRGKALRDDEFVVAEGDLETAVAETAPLKVIADNLRSAFNVGAVMRTAECFGLEEVLLTGYTPTPDEVKTSKTSMGTGDLVAWRSIAKISDALAEVKAQGYRVIALETAEEAETLEDFQWPEKSVLILGNERFGLDPELLSSVDHVVRIPLYGRKNSLNVGIAFGVAAADWRRKLQARDVRPIGVFHSSVKHPYEARRQASRDDSGQTAFIELSAGHDFETALSDLSGFERVWLVYRFHHNANWKPKILPPRGPHVKRGVFATRSPYRPNPIGLSCVRLERVEGRRIYVSEFDLLDGTPIYDIKPYVAYADSFPDAKAGWLDSLDPSDHFTIEISEAAERQLAWLDSNGVSQLRGFLQAQLSEDPLDDRRKRVKQNEEQATIAYRTWRADFIMFESDRRLVIERIRSGYSSADLALEEDRYADKDLHRRFHVEMN
jgi:tRNA-Thr(GGU) m(6)t(6)A37 methyltransferase TsaA